MATIKSFSDLQKSKKLAEILPLETADMCYIQDLLAGCKYGEYKPYIGDLFPAYGQDKIKCWSFAALFAVLPKNLNIGRPSLESNYKGYYWIQYYDEFMLPNDYKTECFNNPVDACYELILKLNELNLL